MYRSLRRQKAKGPLTPAPLPRRGEGFLAFFAALFLLAGCRFGTFPDPNDPSRAGSLQPEVLRRQLKGASDALQVRFGAGEITEGQYRDLLAGYADGLVKSTHIETVDPAKAWEYGEVFRTGRMWKQAEAIFRVAASAAKDDDRRVNDTLRLAEALAHLGRVGEAVDEARKSFDAPPTAKAPILYGVLLEIVPAGVGQDKDLDLARLLEDAIEQSGLTKVDGTTESGKAFLIALPHHQRNARRLAARLYLRVGKDADAERVLAGKAASIRI